MSERSEAIADLIALASAVQPVLGDRLRQIAVILGSDGWITDREPRDDEFNSDGELWILTSRPCDDPDCGCDGTVFQAIIEPQDRPILGEGTNAWMPLPEPWTGEKGGGE